MLMHRIQQPDSPADILAGNFSRMVQLGVIDIPTERFRRQWLTVALKFLQCSCLLFADRLPKPILCTTHITISSACFSCLLLGPPSTPQATMDFRSCWGLTDF